MPFSKQFIVNILNTYNIQANNKGKSFWATMKYFAFYY